VTLDNLLDGDEAPSLSASVDATTDGEEEVAVSPPQPPAAFVRRKAAAFGVEKRRESGRSTALTTNVSNSKKKKRRSRTKSAKELSTRSEEEEEDERGNEDDRQKLEQEPPITEEEVEETSTGIGGDDDDDDDDEEEKTTNNLPPQRTAAAAAVAITPPSNSSSSSLLLKRQHSIPLDLLSIFLPLLSIIILLRPSSSSSSSSLLLSDDQEALLKLLKLILFPPLLKNIMSLNNSIKLNALSKNARAFRSRIKPTPKFCGELVVSLILPYWVGTFLLAPSLEEEATIPGGLIGVALTVVPQVLSSLDSLLYGSGRSSSSSSVKVSNFLLSTNLFAKLILFGLMAGDIVATYTSGGGKLLLRKLAVISILGAVIRFEKKAEVERNEGGAIDLGFVNAKLD
jgi:hypothetical protein